MFIKSNKISYLNYIKYINKYVMIIKMWFKKSWDQIKSCHLK